MSLTRTGFRHLFIYTCICWNQCENRAVFYSAPVSCASAALHMLVFSQSSHYGLPLVWCEIRGHAKLCLYSSGELDKLALVIAVMTTV